MTMITISNQRITTGGRNGRDLKSAYTVWNARPVFITTYRGVLSKRRNVIWQGVIYRNRRLMIVQGHALQGETPHGWCVYHTDSEDDAVYGITDDSTCYPPIQYGSHSGWGQIFYEPVASAREDFEVTDRAPHISAPAQPRHTPPIDELPRS